MIAFIKRLLFGIQPLYRALHSLHLLLRRIGGWLNAHVSRLGLSPERRERAITLIKSAAVIAVCLVLTWLLHRYYFDAMIPEISISLAYAFLTMEILIILFQLQVSIISKVVERYRAKKAEAGVPGMRRALAEHASGQDRREYLEVCSIQGFHDLERCLTDLLAVVDGESRDRLSALAVDLGYRGYWERKSFDTNPAVRREAASTLGLLVARDGASILMRLLDDYSPLVQAAASRALLNATAGNICEELFIWSLDQPFVVRVMLASALRPWADVLARRAIPLGLRSGNSDQVVATLEIVESWRMPVKPGALHPLLFHENPTIQAAALRTLPYQTAPIDRELVVLAGLNAEAEEVRSAAAECASRLKVTGAMNVLSQHSRSGTMPVRQFMEALVQIGEDGRHRVEALLESSDPEVVATAAEILERAHLTRRVA